ncbi:hypothetical protein [Planomonospora parontospora]|nr:hypothetical protein [Planomonospora parontospora]
MWFFRFLAIGLLSGILMVPLLHSPRGDGFEHLPERFTSAVGSGDGM